MRKRSIEGFSDISHTINTHSKSLEHITVEERGKIINLMMSKLYTDKIPKTYIKDRLEVTAPMFNLELQKYFYV